MLFVFEQPTKEAPTSDNQSILIKISVFNDWKALELLFISMEQEDSRYSAAYRVMNCDQKLRLIVANRYSLTLGFSQAVLSLIPELIE
ncbi:MAG: hypothetical protein WBV73_03855 [Phormidium sp.]